MSNTIFSHNWLLGRKTVNNNELKKGKCYGPTGNGYQILKLWQAWFFGNGWLASWTTHYQKNQGALRGADIFVGQNCHFMVIFKIIARKIIARR